MTLSCSECGQDSGTSLVCPACLPLLSAHRREKLLRTWHRLIVERDGNTCAYCGLSAEWDSGELCGNHKHTQGSRPDLVFDLENGECVCRPCNQKFSYTAPKEVKLRKKVRKPRFCSVLGCKLSAIDKGRCWKHAA